MTPQDLTFVHTVRENVLAMDRDLLEASLAASRGEDTMSDKDMKIAILALRGVCVSQQELIDGLFTYLTTVPVKKPWYKRIFQK